MRTHLFTTKWSLLLAMFFSVLFFAQNEKSLLWKVSGNGLEKSSYIFGTIHMICEEDYVMNATIQNALKSTDAYFAELDFTNVEDMAKMQSQIMSSTPLSKRLSDKEYSKLKDLLQETVKLDIAQFENMSDMGIVSMVTFKSFPCEKQKMYEMELLTLALAEKKKPGGIETFDEQMKVLSSSFTMETLLGMLEDLKKNGFKGTKEMVDIYKSQNIDQLIEFMGKASYMDDKVYKTILKDRNTSWFTRMPEQMKKQSTFFAVGAAHLGGKDGVITHFKKIGYKVEPVKF